LASTLCKTRDLQLGSGAL